MSTQHNFENSKQWAATVAREPWVEQMYRRVFPGVVWMHIIDGGESWQQSAGIDRLVVLKCTRTIRIEEKYRRTDYGDFLFERWADKERKIAGWIQRPLISDYLAYVLPTHEVWLYPYLDLRRAWLRYGRDWIELYGTLDADNVCENGRTYKAENVPVPFVVLHKALVEGFHVSLGRGETCSLSD